MTNFEDDLSMFDDDETLADLDAAEAERRKALVQEFAQYRKQRAADDAQAAIQRDLPDPREEAARVYRAAIDSDKPDDEARALAFDSLVRSAANGDSRAIWRPTSPAQGA